jgi:hypothetical protein
LRWVAYIESLNPDIPHIRANKIMVLICCQGLDLKETVKKDQMMKK